MNINFIVSTFEPLILLQQNFNMPLQNSTIFHNTGWKLNQFDLGIGILFISDLTTCNIYANISNVQILRPSCIEDRNVQKHYSSNFLTFFFLSVQVFMHPSMKSICAIVIEVFQGLPFRKI